MSNQGLIPKVADRVAERSILAGLLKDAQTCFYDVDALITDSDFYYPENKIVYSTIKNLILTEGIKQPDVYTISKTIERLDSASANKFMISEYLSVVIEEPVSPDNIAPFVKNVKKLSLRRNLKLKFLEAIQEVDGLDEAAEITEIIATAEKPIVNFTSDMVGGNLTIDMAAFSLDYLKYVATVRPSCLGISSGFCRYDTCIGGGLRPGVHLFGGRAKSGKTFLGLNITDNVSSAGYPVLYLDTELTDQSVSARLCAMMTGVEINTIETGGFVGTEDANLIKGKLKDLVSRKIHYHNISGKNHYEWMSIMRRWLFRNVGLDENGNFKPCLIVLDYIKMMDLRHAAQMGAAEHQYLGQIITDLHNFCLKYQVPIVAMVQLNREGITREDQGILAGSDKLIGLCTSAFIMKFKAPEDLTQDSPTNGDRKLVMLAVRYGPGLDQGDYINLKTDLARGKIEEGPTLSEVKQDSNSQPVNVFKSDNKHESNTTYRQNPEEERNPHIPF